MPSDRIYEHGGADAGIKLPLTDHVTIGPTMLTDWDMEAAGVGAWTAGNGATLTKEVGSPSGSGAQVLQIVGPIGSVHGWAYQMEKLTIKGTYSVNAWWRGNNEGGGAAMQSRPALWLENGGVYTVLQNGTRDATWRQVSLTFTDTAGGSRICLMADRLSSPSLAMFDEVDVRLISPLVRYRQDYPRTNTVASRVHRLCAMHRGAWPANPLLGTDWAQLDKYDESIQVRAQRIIEMGQEPLVKEGVIRDLEVKIRRVWDGGISFELIYTDATTGETGASYTGQAAWVK